MLYAINIQRVKIENEANNLEKELNTSKEEIKKNIKKYREKINRSKLLDEEALKTIFKIVETSKKVNEIDMFNVEKNAKIDI